MRRTVTCLVLVPLFVVMLAACGGSDDDGSTAATTPTAGGAHSSVAVHTDKNSALRFDKDAYSAKAGTVDISYVNDGTQPHTLLIKKNGWKGLAVSKHGDEDEGTVTLTKGTYTLYCNLPGHEAAGMEATLTVS
jgi:plastocyanin